MGRKKKEAISEDELLAIVRSCKSSAIGTPEGDDNVSSRREKLFKRYLGDPYGDERKGQSQVTTRQCLEAVEWTLPSLMRIFASASKIGEFPANNAKDEQQALAESEAVNHAFFRRSGGGFMTLYIYLKDILMSPNAYVKVYWDETDKVTVENYTGLSVPKLETLVNDENVEIIEQSEDTVQVETPVGMVDLPIFDVKVRRTKRVGKVCVDSIPGEEIAISNTLNTVSLENAEFVCHSRLISRSDLLEMGFDAKAVDELSAADKTNEEEEQRRYSTSGNSYGLESADRSTEQILVEEAYLFIDFDGDGVAERRMVTISGETVLANEESSYMPIIAASSVPLPHTHIGLAWMELVEDLQRIDTTLFRQLLNNMYRTNNPRTVAGRGVNLDDLLNDLPNAPIRTTNMDSLRIEPTAPIIGQVLPAFELLDKRKEVRTGVSNRAMGLDADTLSRVTEGVQFGAMEQTNQRLELLARLIAEQGIKPIFLKIHRLLSENQTEAYEAKIKGKWAVIDPSVWRERDDMEVTVGLGTGNKQAQSMGLEKILAVQQGMIAGGMMGTTLSPEDVYNSATKQVELLGFHDGSKFYTHPNEQPPKQPPEPDVLAEAQMALVKVEQEKNQLKMQTDMATLKGKMQDMMIKMHKQEQDFSLKAHDLKRKDKELSIDTLFREEELGMQQDNELNKLQMDLFNFSEKLIPEEMSQGGVDVE